MNSLSKRLEYLGIADLDYLAARLLLIYGLAFQALPQAAEAFEKLLKLSLILEAKITRNEELTPKDLKGYGHDLAKLSKELKTRVGMPFGSDWDGFFKLLQDSYDRRYPEHWKAFQLEISLVQLDGYYTALRNNIVQNFPREEQARARQFGTFIYDAYRPNVNPKVLAIIEGLGGKLPGEVLKWNNERFTDLDFVHSVVSRGI